MLAFGVYLSNNNVMRYEPGDPTRLTLNMSDELQAVGWAASEVRRANPDDSAAQSAFNSALNAGRIRHSEDKTFTIEGQEADDLLSVVRQWVAGGPPENEDPVIYPARAKSYKTACAIVAKTVESPVDPLSASS